MSEARIEEVGSVKLGRDNLLERRLAWKIPELYRNPTCLELGNELMFVDFILLQSKLGSQV
jgi:hypothetical protein